jgi:hypothetical protein
MGNGKFQVFQKLLEFMDAWSDITNATMSNYTGEMEITGISGSQTLRLTLSVTEKEEKEDD